MGTSRPGVAAAVASAAAAVPEVDSHATSSGAHNSSVPTGAGEGSTPSGPAQGHGAREFDFPVDVDNINLDITSDARIAAAELEQMLSHGGSTRQ